MAGLKINIEVMKTLNIHLLSMEFAIFQKLAERLLLLLDLAMLLSSLFFSSFLHILLKYLLAFSGGEK